MAQIRNKADIKNSLLGEKNVSKSLPNFFLTSDEIGFAKGISASILLHIIFVFTFGILQMLLLPFIPKPQLPDKNIEFELVNNKEKPPINKNTNIRTDRNSQAGGKHDPKKKIAEPRPVSTPQVKKAVKQPQQKTVSRPVEKKVVQQPTKQPIKQPQPQKVVQAPQKPALKAPSVAKPIVKPSAKPVAKPNGVAVASAPKIAKAPKSPFVVSAPTTKAPVGATYKPQGVPTVSGAAKGGGASGVPAPKFSATGSSSNSSGGSSGNKYASKGSYGGYGSGGNPGPGNPNGAPGIDAIRQPNWGPYIRDLQARIERNWNPPRGDTSKRVVIDFEISKDGRLLSHKVVKSSGNPLADRAAMSAIELTAPFRPLPPEYREKSVMINFTFDYNVLNSVIK